MSRAEADAWVRPGPATAARAHLPSPRREQVDIHQVAHDGEHSRRKGCRLTHDGLVCGGGSNHGGQKIRHGKGHGNGYGGNKH